MTRRAQKISVKRLGRYALLSCATVFSLALAAGWLRGYSIRDHFEWNYTGQNAAVSLRLHSIDGSLEMDYARLVAKSSAGTARVNRFVTGPLGFSYHTSRPEDARGAKVLSVQRWSSQDGEVWSYRVDAGICYPLLIVPVAIWPALVLLRSIRHFVPREVRQRRTRYAAGLCPMCGYDIRNSPERCPECGVPLGAKALDAILHRGR
jgi:hypothetical protein